MKASVKKGKNIVIGIICILLGVELLTILLYFFSIGSGKIGTQVVRVLLTGALCFFVYNGQNWAKWVTVVLMAIAALTGLIGTLSVMVYPLLGAISFIYFIIYTTVVILLLAPKSVKEFMEHQRK